MQASMNKYMHVSVVMFGHMLLMCACDDATRDYNVKEHYIIQLPFKVVKITMKYEFSITSCILELNYWVNI
jgi:hypothetical protein